MKKLEKMIENNHKGIGSYSLEQGGNEPTKWGVTLFPARIDDKDFIELLSEFKNYKADSILVTLIY